MQTKVCSIAAIVDNYFAPYSGDVRPLLLTPH